MAARNLNLLLRPYARRLTSTTPSCHAVASAPLQLFSPQIIARQPTRQNFSNTTHCAETATTSTSPDQDGSLQDPRLGGRKGPLVVSARSNSETLIEALSPLISGNTPKDELRSVGSENWFLSRDMNSIVRFFAFEHGQPAWDFLTAVWAVAEEMDHHPDVLRIRDPQGTKENQKPDTFVVIACHTHKPAGLSMRDVRLASKINELLRPFEKVAYGNAYGESPNAIIRRRTKMVKELGKSQKLGNTS